VKTPVALVTGYLGSGKTTLIRAMLESSALGETAVIVNELGEIGIDHAILRRVDERTVLLASGCVCCTLRGDLADELRDLVDRRASGEIPSFTRVVVETTGVADPAPILATLVSEPLVRNQYVLESVIATVDAQHGLRGEEAERQVAAADVLVVTKADLADPGAVEEAVGDLNPVAAVVRAVHGDVDPARLLGRRRDACGDSTQALSGRRLGPRKDPRVDSAQALPAPHEGSQRHEDDVAALSVVLDGPVNWLGFGVWLTMLLHARGRQILRVKGLLDVRGDGPVVVDAVQHVVYPPLHLDAWPDEDRRSRLVLIGRGLDAQRLELSLRFFAIEERSLPPPPAAGDFTDLPRA
jgi:G3E family GTPase